MAHEQIMQNGHSGLGSFTEEPRRQIVKASDYKQYEHKEHIYKVPDTYIISADQMLRDELLFNFVDNTMYTETISLPIGVERLFVEAISNSSDNVGKSRRNGVNPGIIEVTMDNKIITIKNGGVPIPVEVHEEGIYTPELIFGRVLTSSNYDVDRHEAGRNGYGAKLINIFSDWFVIEVWDSFNELYYYQKWEKDQETGIGMSIRHEPIIEEYQGESYVKLTYHLNFGRFGYTEYPEEAFNLFYRHCIDVSLNAMVEVKFNDVSLNYSHIEDYARMIFGENLGKHFVHYQWPEGVEVTIKKNGLQVPKDSYTLPVARICVIDTPHNSFNVSFVNSMMTRDGGDHVTAVVKSVSSVVIKSVNDSAISSKKKDKRTLNVTIKDVRPHLSIIILYKAINPMWKGQSKTEYMHNKDEPPIRFDIEEKHLKAMLNWNMVDALFSAMEHKQFNQLVKTDGKKRKNIGPFNGEDANLAGTNKSHECFLLVVEGKSAAAYANTFICSLGARDTMGVFELRGKLLNVMKASKIKIAENNELGEIKRVLGLVEGTDYSTDENFARLRYGGVVFLTDADVDGEHIKALGLNYFHCRFQELLQRDYALWLATPILRASKGKQIIKFYTIPQYEEWKRNTPNSSTWKVKYFKGLATSTTADVKSDAKDPKYVACKYDDRAESYMELAFNDKKADERKKWISNYQPFTYEDVPREVEISSFINYGLIEYSIYDIQRSIPAWDGLKPSHRKILWASYKKWKWNIKRVKEYEEYKVVQFGGFVAEKTSYHHGEQNLYETIIGMAQDFVGSNNLPYFEPRGQFGTRNKGGKDHGSPRYIFTVPQWWLPYVYREEDFLIMEHNEDDGKQVEPKVFLPIIPMSLVNGAQGIGTGWSTYIPPHNIRDLIGWLRDKILKRTPAVIEPWFRGFTGDISIIDKNRKHTKLNGYYDDEESYEDFEELDNMDREYRNNTGENDDEYHIPGPKQKAGKTIKVANGKIIPVQEKPRYSIITTGNYSIINGNTIVITELPIKVWSHNYNLWLEKLLVTPIEDPETKKKYKLITGKTKNEKDENGVYFTITGFERPGYNELKLRRSFALTNMVLLEENGVPVKYESVLDILNNFYERRLPFYYTRREKMISDTEEHIKLLNDKIMFILAILEKDPEKRLKIKNVPKGVIIERMTELGLNTDLYGKAKLTNINKDEVDELLKEMEEKKQRLAWLVEITPEQLWLNDLDEFETEYLKHYDE